MTNMRDEITEILCDASPIEYPQNAADAIMELVQPRIDKLEKVGKVFIDELTKVQARIDKLEQGLRDIKFYSDEEYAIGRATAALKGSDK